MNDYWHIPRASLTPSSASSAVSSASSTQRSKKSLSSKHGKQQLTPTHYHQQHQRIQRHYPGNRTAMIPGGRTVGGDIKRDSDTTMGASTKQMATVAHNSMAPAKRGSRSSQGSDDSNNSTRSAASGSLLLTAANLERMTEIHRKQQQKTSSNNKNFQQLTPHHLAINASTVTTYNANLMHAAAAAARHGSGGGVKAITGGFGSDQMDSIINIDPNLDFVKTKDMDTVSIASSMHFTMVNGEPGGSNKKTKKGLCDRGRQVSVLIISMSMIFLLLIMGMVYALEMRAREMPHS